MGSMRIIGMHVAHQIVAAVPQHLLLLYSLCRLDVNQGGCVPGVPEASLLSRLLVLSFKVTDQTARQDHL